MPPHAPKRPYRNLGEFRHRSVTDLPDADWWPCLTCHGRGGYHKSEDCCYVEGYKHAPWYICPACDGSRRGTRKDCAAAYKTKIREWKEKLQVWRQTQAHRKSGIAKLTKDERIALGL